jgi:hypothetical protein
MHSLELRTEDDGLVEDFIADDISITEKINSKNHNTTVLHISTTQELENITSL